LPIKLEIENFKSIQKLKLDLSDLTILIGPPASGKSNILDALALMGYINRFRVLDREYKNNASNLEPLSSIVRFREPYQLFKNYNLTETIRLKILGDIDLDYEISYTTGIPKITINNKPLPWDLRTLRADPMSEIQNFVKTLPIFESRLYGFDRYGLISDVYFLSLSRIRDYPSYILSEMGWNIPYIIRRHIKVINNINDILREHIGEKIELKVRKTGEILIFDNDNEIELVGISETILRVLYTLLALESSQFYAKYYNFEKKLIVLLEEPEAHVFPYFIDIIADSIDQALVSTYVIISTHNPILISRLWDYVKNVKTYYVYRNSIGFTSVRELDIEKMAEDLKTTEDILIESPSEILEKYTLEAERSAESKTSTSQNTS
jgi:predicted ATPase